MISTFQLGVEEFPLLESVQQKYVNTGLTYGWKADTNLSYDQGHWNKQIIKNSNIFPCDLSKTSFMNYHPEIRILWDIICSAIGPRALMRAYVNGYTYGTDAYAHYDDKWITDLHGTDALSETAVVYLNKKWHIDWCGETVIFDDQNEIAASIIPRYGRVLMFNSDLLHAARPVSRVCPVLRTILAFKTFNPKIVSKPMQYLQDNVCNIKHSGRTFFEHLFNAMMILESRKNDKEILLAGLFHSIYGTGFFEYDANVSRETVKELIGEYAES